MKTLMLTTALVLASTAAFAGDFDSNEVVLSAKSGGLKFSLGSVDGNLTSVSTTGTFANYQLGRFDSSADLSVTYGRADETLGAELAYNLSTDLNESLSLYGTAAVAYTAPTADLGDGVVTVAPTVGAAYSVTESLSVFSDVTYAWDATNDWAEQGGSLAIGADYAVSETVSIAPSVIRTFNTGADATNMKVEATLRF